MHTSGFYYWLCNTPPVMVYAMHEPDEYLGDEKVYKLRQLFWEEPTDDLLAKIEENKKTRPQDVIIPMVPTQQQYAELSAAGVHAVHFGHNATADERVFKPVTAPLGAASPGYAAVYVARMTPWKRHELAAKVHGRVLFIGGVTPTPDDDNNYFNSMQEKMPQHFFTHKTHPYNNLAANRVVTHFADAKVGLALSACEGGMFASVEYLLAGLPVVSTESRGGRDALFDPRFCRIVPDDPDAVSHAVKELGAMGIDRHFVRRETLKKIRQQRRNFVDTLQNIFDAEGTACDAARFFYSRFHDKFMAGRYWQDAVGGDMILPHKEIAPDAA